MLDILLCLIRGGEGLILDDPLVAIRGWGPEGARWASRHPSSTCVKVAWTMHGHLLDKSIFGTKNDEFCCEDLHFRQKTKISWEFLGSLTMFFVFLILNDPDLSKTGSDLHPVEGEIRAA